MFKQILKTKEVPDRDINEMIAGYNVEYLHTIVQRFLEYKKLNVETEDDSEDGEQIYYDGKYTAESIYIYVTF